MTIAEAQSLPDISLAQVGSDNETLLIRRTAPDGPNGEPVGEPLRFGTDKRLYSISCDSICQDGHVIARVGADPKKAIMSLGLPTKVLEEEDPSGICRKYERDTVSLQLSSDDNDEHITWIFIDSKRP